MAPFKRDAHHPEKKTARATRRHTPIRAVRPRMAARVQNGQQLQLLAETASRVDRIQAWLDSLPNASTKRSSPSSEQCPRPIEQDLKGESSHGCGRVEVAARPPVTSNHEHTETSETNNQPSAFPLLSAARQRVQAWLDSLPGARTKRSRSTLEPRAPPIERDRMGESSDGPDRIEVTASDAMAQTGRPLTQLSEFPLFSGAHHRPEPRFTASRGAMSTNDYSPRGPQYLNPDFVSVARPLSSTAVPFSAFFPPLPAPFCMMPRPGGTISEAVLPHRDPAAYATQPDMVYTVSPQVADSTLAPGGPMSVTQEAHELNETEVEHSPPPSTAQDVDMDTGGDGYPQSAVRAVAVGQ